MTKYLSKYLEPDFRNRNSQTFSLVELGKRLLDASKNGHTDLVLELLANNAPFTTDWIGVSALHFAAMNGHTETCEALIYAGSMIDARTKVDRTPLHLAAQEGHADIVNLLLKSKAEIDSKDMFHMTALHWAAERGHIHVIQVLLYYGASLSSKNKFELTPIELASLKKHQESVKYMMAFANSMDRNSLFKFNVDRSKHNEVIIDDTPIFDLLTNQKDSNLGFSIVKKSNADEESLSICHKKRSP